MPNLLRNVLALLAGIAIGGGVNMALITVSPSLIPPPSDISLNQVIGDELIKPGDHFGADCAKRERF